MVLMISCNISLYICSLQDNLLSNVSLERRNFATIRCISRNACSTAVTVIVEIIWYNNLITMIIIEEEIMSNYG